MGRHTEELVMHGSGERAALKRPWVPLDYAHAAALASSSAK